MKIKFIILFLFITHVVSAQDANTLITKGNDFYKRNDLRQAYSFYDQALRIDNKNITAQYNIANTLHRQGRFADAAKQYDQIIKNTSDKDLLAKAFYNKGIAEVRQHLTEDAIESFKQSLRYNGTDEQARENLQKALNEQQQKQKKNKDNKQQQNQPKDNNKMNKQQMDRELDKLRDEEKHLQQQVQQQKVKQGSSDKDW